MRAVTSPAAGDERVVVDATIRVTPPFFEGFCMDLGAGRLTITAGLVGDAEPLPADLSFSGQRDPGADRTLPVGRNPAGVVIPLAGGAYCWYVDVMGPPGADQLPEAERAAFAQWVAVKMVLTPR